jgi:hypothetical protein
MDEASSHPTQKVEDEVSDVAKSVLDVITKDIKEPHVAKNMKKSSVKKH